MASRQIVLSNIDKEGTTQPMGSIRALMDVLAPFNVAPDSADPTAEPTGESGTVFFHGPGLVIQVPTFADAIMQAMVSFNDEDWAWPVLLRIRKATGWSFQDMETGQIM